jgi:hypothetical protein
MTIVLTPTGIFSDPPFLTRQTGESGRSTPCQKWAYKTNLGCFSRLSLLRPADTELKFCVGNEKNSPNSHKAFIHAAFVSGPGHQHLSGSPRCAKENSDDCSIEHNLICAFFGLASLRSYSRRLAQK